MWAYLLLTSAAPIAWSRNDYCLALLPKLMVPLPPGGTFSFTYSVVPYGKYALRMLAQGQRGGAADEDDAAFAVVPCPTP